MQIVEACFPNTLVTGRDVRVAVDEMVARVPDGQLVIVYRRGLSTPEQRYAIAHAIGHIVFDGTTFCSAKPDDEREVRCDRLADELLVPLDELAPYVGCWPTDDEGEQRDVYLDMVDLIASHFGVLAAVIDRRIRELPRPFSF